MKIIDLLNKIANNEEVPNKIKWANDEWSYSNGPSKNYLTDLEDLFSVIDGSNLNDEIEIIEEETTHEQNFTGWKLIQNGKVVASYGYDEPALKPADIIDVEKDVKKMLEEKPKKIEELEEIREITQDCFDNWTCAKRINQLNENQKKIINVVNYLLEKESDK